MITCDKIIDAEIQSYNKELYQQILMKKATCKTQNFDSNKTKIDEKSYKNILIYYTGYVTIKDLKYVKINSINILYLSKVNRYFEKLNKNKYLTLVPTNESKENIKNYEELWSKIRDLIRSVTKILIIMMKNIGKSNLIQMTSYL